MSDASEKLARSRQAILDHMARRQRKHDPREIPAGATDTGAQADLGAQEPPPYARQSSAAGLLGHAGAVLRMWWQHHPAHMAVELANPLMRSYARRKPLQLVGIALAAGAALTFARPWRLISITTLLIALLKSSQLSSLFMAALSAADYRKDDDRTG